MRKYSLEQSDNKTTTSGKALQAKNFRRRINKERALFLRHIIAVEDKGPVMCLQVQLSIKPYGDFINFAQQQAGRPETEGKDHQ